MLKPKLDRNLNFVIPLVGGAIVYAIPISKAVFEQHYMELAKVYSTIQEQGLITTGASIAARMLRQLEDQQHVNIEPLLSEIRRLCQVAIPSDSGYNIELLDDARRKDLLDDEDVSEVENFLAFSIAVSHLSSRAQAASLLEWVRGMRNVEVTSLSFTALLDSFKTSIEKETSGQKQEKPKEEYKVDTLE